MEGGVWPQTLKAFWNSLVSYREKHLLGEMREACALLRQTPVLALYQLGKR